MAQVQYDNLFPDLLQLQDLQFADEMQMDGNEVMPPPPEPRGDITVFVSGQTFYIIPSLFDQVRGLPWYQVGGLYHLDAEADLFEIVLQFYLTGALPSKALVKKRRESLHRLVAPLQNAIDLQKCVNQGIRKKTYSNQDASSKKSFFSFKSKKTQSKAFGDSDDSNSIVSGALSQVTQATTVTMMSERESPKTQPKTGWSIINRTSKKELLHQSLRSEYIVWASTLMVKGKIVCWLFYLRTAVWLYYYYLALLDLHYDKKR